MSPQDGHTKRGGGGWRGERKTERKRQTDRQTDKQIDRQKHSQRERNRKRHRKRTREREIERERGGGGGAETKKKRDAYRGWQTHRQSREPHMQTKRFVCLFVYWLLYVPATC